MANQASDIVIIGGNGKTGRRVTERLIEKGEAVRAVSRRSAVPFDWHEPDTWAPAVRGARALYLTYYPDLAVPGAAEHVRALTRVAAEAGVSRVVLLAGRGEPQVHPAEAAVRTSGMEFTILECAFFSQNFSEGVLAPHDGVIAFPAGLVREPFIDCDDIADVAVAALLESGHVGKTYELTGPQAITFAQATHMIAESANQPISYQQLSFQQYAKLLEEHMPAPQIDFFIALFRFLLDGHNSHTTDGVEQVLGRPAKSFQQFADNNFSRSNSALGNQEGL